MRRKGTASAQRVATSTIANKYSNLSSDTDRSWTPPDKSAILQKNALTKSSLNAAAFYTGTQGRLVSMTTITGVKSLLTSFRAANTCGCCRPITKGRPSHAA
ncbi:hypothetical protein ElyMa_004887100 [Elysia marginata]|uniref:Uncharacterized protein n=1 Tax=Elysia marginata TaxID=1093978 RepID=A0AAV4ISL2_9GAST|nr:hypothetical protein ElyMa_004887100 [Elysia marginata]